MIRKQADSCQGLCGRGLWRWVERLRKITNNTMVIVREEGWWWVYGGMIMVIEGDLT